MTKFKVGDRVTTHLPLSIWTLYHHKEFANIEKMKATIRGLPIDDDYYAIEFDDYIGGITCYGLCKDGHGWWRLETDLKKLKKEEQ